MEQPEPLPEYEWNINENDFIGMTQYRLKDLPTWAKEQLKKPTKKPKITFSIYR
jgi:hypothetical protein